MSSPELAIPRARPGAALCPCSSTAPAGAGAARSGGAGSLARAAPGALPRPAHTRSSQDPRKHRGSAGRPERRDFPLPRSPDSSVPVVSAGSAQSRALMLVLNGPRSAWGHEEPPRWCLLREAARAAGPPAPPEPPRPISVTGELAAKPNWTAQAATRPVPGPVGAQRRGTDRQGRGGQRCCREPGSGRSGSERRAVPEGKAVSRGGTRGGGTDRPDRTRPDRDCTGAGRASRAGLVTWGTRPSQDPPRARDPAHAQCRPAALPECHVRGRGPRETAALTNRERHREERGQWRPAGGERGRRPTRGGGRGTCPDRQPMGGAQRQGQWPRPMGGGRRNQ